jgi:putative membrane protein
VNPTAPVVPIGPSPWRDRAARAAAGTRSIVTRLAAAVDPTEWGPAGPVAVAWLLTMLAIPFAEWIVGVPGRTGGVAIAVLLQATTVVMLLARSAGTVAAARMAGAVVAVAWASEAVGAATGIPFGDYGYTDLLHPQLLDVPLLIPLAWLMMLPAAWAVAARITGRIGGVGFVVVSALAMTAWDLSLDPQMVAWGLWTWDDPGLYFGIPLVNFAGWLLVSAAATVLARPARLPVRPLLVIYTVTWAIEGFGLAVFWGMVGPAVAGLTGMGVFVLLAWRAKRPWA